MSGHWNIGRYQFIMWRRWAFSPYRRVIDPPLGYIYDRLGMYGPIEIRRFARLPHPLSGDR